MGATVKKEQGTARRVIICDSCMWHSDALWEVASD